jgi:hypothetical protein
MIRSGLFINEIKGVTVYIEDVENIEWDQVLPEEDFVYTEAK